MISGEIKRIIIENLSVVEPRLIIIFGSTAKGEEFPDSDIDIAFLSKKKIDDVARFELQEEIAYKLQKDVDLVDMDKANDVINFEIVTKGEIIFKEEGTEIEKYIDLVYLRYLQLNDDRREIIEDAIR